MAAVDRQRMQRRRRGVIAGGLAVWVIAVIVGAGPAGDDALLGVERVEVLWLASMAVLAILGLVLLIVLNPFSGHWTEPEKKKRRPWGLFLLLLLALVIWKPDLLDGLASVAEDGAGSELGLEALQEAEDGDIARTAPVAQATDVLMVLAVVAALGGAWVVARRRLAAPDEPVLGLEVDGPHAAELHVSLGQAVAVLRDTSDPRVAVMQSYALLEDALAEQGHRRKASQTPAEHMRQVLQNLEIDPAPVVHLGALYERARFSGQTITEADKINAASALDRSRQQLAIQP